jgi:hypothetical protein
MAPVMFTFHLILIHHMMEQYVVLSVSAAVMLCVKWLGCCNYS